MKPAEGGGGSSLVGLGEREVPGRSLMTVDEAFVPRKRRTPFILPTGLEATVGQKFQFRVFLSCVQPQCGGMSTAPGQGKHNGRGKKKNKNVKVQHGDH